MERKEREVEGYADAGLQKDETVSSLRDSEKFLCATVKNDAITTSMYGPAVSLLAMLACMIRDLREAGVSDERIGDAVALGMEELPEK